MEIRFGKFLGYAVAAAVTVLVMAGGGVQEHAGCADGRDGCRSVLWGADVAQVHP